MSDRPVARRTAAGKHALVRTTDERATDSVLFKEPIAVLLAAVDVLGGPQPPLEAIHEAIEQTKDAIRKLRNAEAGVGGWERKEALALLRPLVRDMQDIEKLLLTQGG